MKRVIAFLVCILVGMGCGWYLGRTYAISEYQRETLQKLPGLEAQLAEMNKQRAEEFKAWKPYEASGVSIALAALKSWDAGDMEDAKARLAAIVAVYYCNHSKPGDTNLLASIASFAIKDMVLSNAIGRRPKPASPAEVKQQMP